MHERFSNIQSFFLSFPPPGFYVDAEWSERVPKSSLLSPAHQELQEGLVGKDHSCGSECEPAWRNTIEITFDRSFTADKILSPMLRCELKLLADSSGLRLFSARPCRPASFFDD